MKWTKERPTEEGWYWYNDDWYGPAPVLVRWSGFVDSNDLELKQLEIDMAFGDEQFQPCGRIDELGGKWGSDKIIEPN